MAVGTGSNASRTTIGKKKKQIMSGSSDPSGSASAAVAARKRAIDAAKAKYQGTGTVASAGPAAGLSGPTYTAPKVQAASTPPTIVPSGSTGREASGVPGGEPAISAASTGDSADILAKLTGKVGGYGIRQDAIPMLYQEPQALLRMTMQNMGMDPNKNAGMYNMALPNADLVNALSMIGLGGQKGFNAGENSNVLNYMDELFRQGLTRGGQGVDFSAGMDNILGASKDSPLANMMNLDDPRGQYAAVSSLMLPLAEAGLHPLFARSLQKSMEGLRDEYYQKYANAANPPANFQNFAGGRLGL